jgi:SAM-dependent methyltransferase
MRKKDEQKLLKLVRDGYEQIADNFATTRDKQLWPEIIRLTEPVKDGDSVFDVGCGNGRLLDAFKDKKIRYLGIDESAKLIEIAKRNNESRIMNNEFLVGNILDLDDLVKGKFNYIFSFAVLHHLPGEDLRVEALRQMKNKLYGDRKIIISVWNLWSQKKYLKLILEFAWQKIIGWNKMDFGDIVFDWKNSKGEIMGPRYYHAFTKKELKRIVGKAGLRIEKLYKDKYNYYLIMTKHLR